MFFTSPGSSLSQCFSGLSKSLASYWFVIICQLKQKQNAMQFMWRQYLPILNSDTRSDTCLSVITGLNVTSDKTSTPFSNPSVSTESAYIKTSLQWNMILPELNNTQSLEFLCLMCLIIAIQTKSRSVYRNGEHWNYSPWVVLLSHFETRCISWQC